MAAPYHNLDRSSMHIRLLELLPLKQVWDQPHGMWFECANIECRLTVESLDTAPTYDALSYAWGNEDPTVPVTINGKRTLIRPNLASALAALRCSKPLLLWIDAICINQDNLHERNHQVRLMGDIYRRARQVWVWLGRPGPGINSLAVDTVKMLQGFGKFPPVSHLPPPPPISSSPQESQFDRWVRKVKASSKPRLEEKQQAINEMWSWRHMFQGEKQEEQVKKEIKRRELVLAKKRWELDWGIQLRRWSRVKEDRERLRRLRQCVPDILHELDQEEEFLAQERKELRHFQSLELTQRDVLNALQELARTGERRLEKPLFRLLERFKLRQESAFEKAGFKLHLANIGTGRYEADDALPLPSSLGRRSQVPNKRIARTSQTQALYDQITFDLGELQRFSLAMRERLDKESKHSLPKSQEAEREHLKELKRLDVDELRELVGLNNQVAGWLGLENAHSQSLKSLVEAQERDLKLAIRDWNDSRERVLGRYGPWRNSELERRERLGSMVSRQIDALLALKTKHEDQWAQSPPARSDIDLFLTESEHLILAGVKTQKRLAHQQAIARRLTELQRQTPEHALRQYGKWRNTVYRMARALRPLDAERQELRTQLIKAQTGWEQRWNEVRVKETERWQRRVSQLDHTDQPLSTVLFNLTNFCDLPYWSRLWIVQEVLLAKDLTLCFGDDARTTIGWDTLTRARAALGQISTSWKLDKCLEGPLSKVKSSIPFQLDRLRECSERGWPLHNLLKITESSVCREPRDKIYGLLGIANDCRPEDIDIDYSQPLDYVYRDVLAWYQREHGNEEECPSLVRLSQTMQLSFRTCDEFSKFVFPTAIGNSTAASLSLGAGEFGTMAVLKGPIVPFERLLDDASLIRLRQQDWISVVIDYLDSSGLHKKRSALEKELVYMDSIITRFAMQPYEAAYATDGEPRSKPNDAARQPFSCNGDTVEEKSELFMLETGQFGVASTCIREGDMLCEFKDSQCALIIRSTGDRYALVSKAILSNISADGRGHGLSVQSGLRDLAGSTAAPGTHHQPTAAPVIRVQLDAATLWQLTLPVELSTRHKWREPSCVQGGGFGWYEFMTLGLDVEPRESRHVVTASASQEAAPRVPEPSPEDPMDVEEVPVVSLGGNAFHWQQTNDFMIDEPPVVDTVWSHTWPAWIR